MSERIAFFGYEELSYGVRRKAKVGGKGANLLELTEQGFPVPDGYVVTTDAYQEFLRDEDIEDRLDEYEGLDTEDPEAVDEFRETVEQLIMSTPLPDPIQTDIEDAYAVIEGGPVAVRSSATAEDLPDGSFAGQLETYLNVEGADDVVEAVRKCWASVFTRRAITYRAEQGYDVIDVDIAVVVQQMVPAEKSGVLFTVNPETGDDETIVETSWGLGESIVGGEVSPDLYTLRDGEVEARSSMRNGSCTGRTRPPARL